jgi:polar amino acid transport system substrate-binding protein
VATSLTITRDREAKFAFTAPFSDASVAILKRKGDSRINSAKDLQGMIVASQAGAPQIAVLKEYEASVLKPTTGHGVKEIKAFIDYNEAYAALAAHRVDAVVQSLPNLAPLVKTRGDTFEIVRRLARPPGTHGPEERMRIAPHWSNLSATALCS